MSVIEINKDPNPGARKLKSQNVLRILVKIVVANEESDASTSVRDEVHYNIKLAEVTFPRTPTYKVRVKNGLRKTLLHLTACLEETVAGPN